MSVELEIKRVLAARNKIRNKTEALGVTSNPAASITDLATAIDGIKDNGAITAQLQEGETYNIPKGYHNGSGTVQGIKGGGNYTLQTKIVTPTKDQQNVSPDKGYYGLSAVTVNAIPPVYQDVSSVTVTAPDILANKIAVGPNGEAIAGTMPNNGAVVKTLDATTTSAPIARGYHDGKGSVKIELETKNITPTKKKQTISSTPGKVISSIVVDPIPNNFTDSSSATATAEDLKSGATAWINNEKVTGTMPVNASKATTVLNVDKAEGGAQNNLAYTIPKGFHDGTSTVKIVPEKKTVTPTKSSQVIIPTATKVLEQVTINPIPADYQDVTGVTVTAGQMLVGSTAVSAEGETISGSMPNNGALTKTIDGLNTMSVVIPAGYTTGGSVTLTDDIEKALAAI